MFMNHKSNDKKTLGKLPPIVYLHCFSPCIWYQVYNSLICRFVPQHGSLNSSWEIASGLSETFLCAHESSFTFWECYSWNITHNSFLWVFCLFVGIALKLMSLSYLLKISNQCKPILFGMWKNVMINGSSFTLWMYWTMYHFNTFITTKNLNY